MLSIFSGNFYTIYRFIYIYYMCGSLSSFRPTEAKCHIYILHVRILILFQTNRSQVSYIYITCADPYPLSDQQKPSVIYIYYMCGSLSSFRPTEAKCHIYILHVRILILFQTNRSQVSYIYITCADPYPLSDQQKPSVIYIYYMCGSLSSFRPTEAKCHIYILHVRILILFQTNRSQVSYIYITCADPYPLSDQQKPSVIYIYYMCGSLSSFRPTEAKCHIYILHVRILILFQTNRSQVSYEPLSEQQKYEIRQQCRRYLEGSLDEIDVCSLHISSILHPVIHTRSPQDESHIHSYSIPDQNTSNKLPHNSARNIIGNVPKVK